MEIDERPSPDGGWRLGGPAAASGWDSQRCEAQRLAPSCSDLENLLGIYDQNRRRTDADVTNCTWQDVLEKMDDARRNYQQKGQRNALRGFFRHGQSIKMVFSPILEVIPEDHGLKALKGGLALLFSCLAKREENVEKILACFEDIPFLIENSRETLETFHANPQLCDYVWGLHRALLTGIPHLIRVLLGKSDSKWWTRFLQKIPSEQGRLIADTLSTVDIAKKRLTEYAETIGYRTLVEIQQTAAKTGTGVSEIRLDVREMSTDLKLGFWGLMQALQGITRSIDLLREENAQQRAQIADISKQNKCIHVMQTAVYHIGQETLPRRPASLPSPYQPTLRFDSYYLEALCRSVSGPRACLHATDDLESILGKKYQFEEESIGKSRWLLTSRKFQSWLTVPDSGALVAHSYGDLSTEGKTSAMSVFCGTLTSALLRQRENVIVLSFFCGLHDDERDTFSGPVGMLRSLVVQLLLVTKGMPGPKPQDHPAMNHSALMQDLAAGVPDALAYVFRECAAQLPAGTVVFCLVDAADVYDTRRNGWLDDLGHVFRLLARLVYEGDDHHHLLPSFKILVTTPARCDTVLREMMAPPRPGGTRFPDPVVDMSAGQVDTRPLTEEAIVADIRGLDSARGDGAWVL